MSFNSNFYQYRYKNINTGSTDGKNMIMKYETNLCKNEFMVISKQNDSELNV